jgi:hypothetical protein
MKLDTTQELKAVGLVWHRQSSVSQSIDGLILLLAEVYRSLLISIIENLCMIFDSRILPLTACEITPVSGLICQNIPTNSRIFSDSSLSTNPNPIYMCTYTCIYVCIYLYLSSSAVSRERPYVPIQSFLWLSKEGMPFSSCHHKQNHWTIPSSMADLILIGV